MSPGSRAALALEPLRARFTGRTALVFAPGPSLSKLWNGCTSDFPKIAVGNSYKLVPDADILYHTDFEWWLHYKPEFAGTKVCYSTVYNGVIAVEGVGVEGYDPRLGFVKNGNNSGYVGVHLAAQLGANPIIMIGFDMHPDKHGRNHYFGEHSGKLRRMLPYADWVKNFRGLKQELDKLDIKLFNATPGSALDIPQIRLEDVLGELAA